jgi:hypothetical protein
MGSKKNKKGKKTNNFASFALLALFVSIDTPTSSPKDLKRPVVSSRVWE